MEITVNLNGLALQATFLIFLFFIKDKLRGQWFEDATDRDGTFAMFAVVGLNVFVLLVFGTKFSIEVMAGIAIGFANALGIIVAFHYKDRENKQT